jgi:hypothetical protein
VKDSKELPNIFDTTIHEKNSTTELMKDTDLIYKYCRINIESGHFEHAL